MWAFFGGCARKIKLRGNEWTIDTAGFLGNDVCMYLRKSREMFSRSIYFVFICPQQKYRFFRISVRSPRVRFRTYMRYLDGIRKYGSRPCNSAIAAVVTPKLSPQNVAKVGTTRPIRPVPEGKKQQVRRSESKTREGIVGGRLSRRRPTRAEYLRYRDEIPDFYRVRILFGRFESIC
jgi:hypothetical protein